MKDWKVKKVPLTKKNSWVFDKWGYRVEHYNPAIVENKVVGGLFNKHIEEVEVSPERWIEHPVIFEKAKDAKDFIKILQEQNNG
jgi:hypothetical protein